MPSSTAPTGKWRPPRIRENGLVFSISAPVRRAAACGRESASGPKSFPDGTTVTSDQSDVNRILSSALNRDVTLGAAQRGTVQAEEYWPDMEGLGHRDTVTDFTLPEGTFFDCAVIHLLTTATLDRLRELYPQGRSKAGDFVPTRGAARSGERAPRKTHGSATLLQLARRFA